jgi:hypothetical protein
VLSRIVSNDLEIPLPSPGDLSLAPGTHLLTWSATKSTGITGEGIQIIRIDPMIEFAEDHSMPPEGALSCPLLLNGAVARYPVTLPYTLSGVRQTDLSEELIYEGTHLIKSAEHDSSLTLIKGLIDEINAYQSLRLVMGTQTHAVVGEKVSVVIPQRQAIAAESIDRKLTPSGWQAFSVDENNIIKSAPGKAGSCPLPGAELYTASLTAGDWCVELTIEDGGANDGDGESNGRISHPGGVTSLLSEGETDNNTDDSDDTTDDSDDENGGGGALSF